RLPVGPGIGHPLDELRDAVLDTAHDRLAEGALQRARVLRHRALDLPQHVGGHPAGQRTQHHREVARDLAPGFRGRCGHRSAWTWQTHHTVSGNSVGHRSPIAALYPGRDDRASPLETRLCDRRGSPTPRGHHSLVTLVTSSRYGAATER